jgi:hypothetical protein
MTAASALGAAWAALDRELDLWAIAGHQAYFWWRDDDAVEVTPALEQLLALQDAVQVPMALAVIPSLASAELAKRIAAYPAITPLQHGFAHTNHAAPGEKKSEFPSSRPLAARLHDLQEGRARFAALFPNAPAVFVPPWNRYGSDLVPHLPPTGFEALSAFRIREDYWALHGRLVQVNTHIDPVGWRQPQTDGCSSALRDALRALQVIRSNAAAQQPLGLLTHHLRHDAAQWAFIAEFLDRIKHHPGACWVDFRGATQIGRAA